MIRIVIMIMTVTMGQIMIKTIRMMKMLRMTILKIMSMRMMVKCFQENVAGDCKMFLGGNGKTVSTLGLWIRLGH